MSLSSSILNFSDASLNDVLPDGRRHHRDTCPPDRQIRRVARRRDGYRRFSEGKGLLAREFDDLEAFTFLIGLYESGRMRFAELEIWLRRHTRAR